MWPPVEWDRAAIIITPRGRLAIYNEARHAHVWAAFSPENEEACRSIWQSSLRDSTSVTFFNEDAPFGSDLAAMLGSAIEHYGKLSMIVVIGDVAAADADRIFADEGYVRHATSPELLEYVRAP